MSLSSPRLKQGVPLGLNIPQMTPYSRSNSTSNCVGRASPSPLIEGLLPIWGRAYNSLGRDMSMALAPQQSVVVCPVSGMETQPSPLLIAICLLARLVDYL